MTRRFNLLILIPLISVLLIAAALLYLNYADLGGWRYPVERLISESLSREMAINGIFEPEIGLTTSITAGNLTLANADWGSSPTMLSIDHLELEFSLLSLLFRPIRIERLEIDGVRVLIETDVEGHANWHFQTGDEDEGDSGPLKLALGKIDLTDLEVISRDASLDHTVELGFTSLNIRGDQTDTLDLTLDGHLNRTGLSMTGRLGPLADVLQGKALQFDLTGNLGAIEFSTGGQIADLKTLGGADLRAEIHGADLAAAAEIFGLSDLEKGPFRLALDVRPETSGTGFELDISAGGVGAEIAGTVDSLIAPGMLDVMVEASGPNVATVGKVFGVDDLPVEDFSISGQVRWQGFSISCDNIKVRVGDNSLSADGVLGRPPLM
ncbi:MAG: AsmA family protein, partial [Deltaproteobacteria bacterium]|nr:AsmA family protein [Deltaproteobacteria bacterium]